MVKLNMHKITHQSTCSILVYNASPDIVDSYPEERKLQMLHSDQLTIIDEDGSFIEKLKVRDTSSYTILYNRYRIPLFNLAYRLTGSIAESEDILQETFIRIYDAIEQFNGKSKLFTWIYSICLNLCYRHQNNKKKPTYESIGNLILEHSGWDYRKDQYSEEEWHYYSEQIKDGCLTALICCLPFSQRAVFVLHILLKLSLSSVATILNKSNGSIRVLIHRGRQKIKNFLCSNCSLFKESNRCNCMNFVDYSLQNGLIEEFNKDCTFKKPSPHTQSAQHEIDELKKIVILYDSLQTETPSFEAIKAIRKAIKNDKRVIFAKKV
jgi:RNA polymerase sigma-70 factor (ECF subfamily)